MTALTPVTLLPDSQPDIVHHGRGTRRLDQARAHVKLYTRLIAEELSVKEVSVCEGRAAWIIVAQASRREWFSVLRRERTRLDK